jgi:hypothetical protein
VRARGFSLCLHKEHSYQLRREWYYEHNKGGELKELQKEVELREKTLKPGRKSAKFAPEIREYVRSWVRYQDRDSVAARDVLTRLHSFLNCYSTLEKVRTDTTTHVDGPKVEVNVQIHGVEFCLCERWPTYMGSGGLSLVRKLKYAT